MKKNHQIRRWRNYLLNRRLQFRQTAILVFFTLLISTILGATIVYQSHMYLNIITQMLSPDDVLLKEISALNHKLTFWTIGFVMLYLIILTFIGVITSHTVAVPLYRICKQLKGLTGKNFSRIHFREKNEYREIEEAYNSAMVCLENHNKTQIILSSEIHTGVEALYKTANSDTGISSDLKHRIDELYRKSLAMESTLN